MNKIGMVGGLGPESTLDYYNLLIKKYREKCGNDHNAEIIIDSIDLNTVLGLVDKKDYSKLTDYLLKSIESLQKAGAGFAFISANTPHIVFDEVNKLSPIELISIINATCNKIKELNIKKVGLLGTQFTMESDLYIKPCLRNNIDVIVPSKDERDYIQNKLMTEIELGVFKEETKNGLLKIIKRFKDEENIEAVILGCTELPLILTEDHFGIKFLNTTAIHVDSVIEKYIGGKNNR